MTNNLIGAENTERSHVAKCLTQLAVFSVMRPLVMHILKMIYICNWIYFLRWTVVTTYVHTPKRIVSGLGTHAKDIQYILHILCIGIIVVSYWLYTAFILICLHCLSFPILHIISFVLIFKCFPIFFSVFSYFAKTAYLQLSIYFELVSLIVDMF